jgi:hemerythrin-like domain-containing protein
MHELKGHQSTVHCTDILVAEHEVIGSVLGAVESELDRVAIGAAIDNHFWKGALDFFATFADRCHHGKEEDLLFPALGAAGLPIDGGPVPCLLAEHEQGRCQIKAMRAAVDSSDRGGLEAAGREYCAMLREHIDKENNVLFALARKLISPEASARVLEGFQRHEHDDLKEGTHQRYLALAKELCQRTGASFHGPGS